MYCKTHDPHDGGHGSAQSKLAVRNILSAKSKYISVPLLVLCTSLSGCGTILSALTGGKADSSVSAEDIDLVKDNLLPIPTDGKLREKQEYLGRVVSDSEHKCGLFLNGLVLGENTTNTTLDLATTAFSALSTAFTPPGTKTALSAAASIASGSKTAIDTDIYAKAAIADFSTAIQKTYSAGIRDYTDKLPTLPDTDSAPLIVSNEVAKIQAIHALCGLAPAESSLQAKLGTTDGYTLPSPPPGGAGSRPAGAEQTPAQHQFFQSLQNQQGQAAVTHAPISGAPW